MTHSQKPEAQSGDSGEMVTLQVEVRREHARLMRGFAAREGASVEALASLWLEEKLDEAMRSSRSSQVGSEGGGE
ncbi:MAG: hypothetical protein M3437_16435 [Chloroflexota bacterium]|nr:hypothetical protein [Chloroflexota bacterium]MDQ5864835.1 hypothetical protein [Chloroflexota bacterium]